MQHVNLYQLQFQTRRDPLSARNLLLVMIALVLSLVAVSLWLQSSQPPLDARVASLEEQRTALEAALNVTRERLQAARARAQSDGRIAPLQAELAAKQSVLELLGGGVDGRRGRGFSPYLEGLARSVVDRLWLSDIRIDQGGDTLRLAGHSLEPALVPALISALGSAEAYRGHEFRTVELLRSPDHAGRIDFVLASGAAEGTAR